MQLILLCIHWQPRFNPGVKSSEQRVNVFPTMFSQRLCHTGTRCLVWSSAVRDDCSIFGELVEITLHLISGNPDRSGQFSFCFAPRRWITRINEGKLLAAVHAFLHFIHCDSSRFHSASSFYFPPLSSQHARHLMHDLPTRFYPDLIQTYFLTNFIIVRVYSRGRASILYGMTSARPGIMRDSSIYKEVSG